MTFAVLTLYTVSKTGSGNISEAGFTPQNLEALNRQLTLKLAQNAEFRGQSAAQKQRIWEGAILTGALVGALNGQAQQSGNAQIREQARAAADRAFQKLLGVVPSSARLTDAGLQLE